MNSRKVLVQIDNTDQFDEMMGQTEQSEHIATGLKFIEAEVISLSNSQFYIILHHIM